MSLIGIDELEKVHVEEGDCPNELRTLDCLRFGLHQLASAVWEQEQAIRVREEKVQNSTMFWGVPPGMDERIALILPCLFQWYGVSLCNYAGLVGFVRGIATGRINRSMLEDRLTYSVIKNECRNYVKSIPEIAAVLVWRNKIASHFAVTDPYKHKTDPQLDDNIATLDMSVMYPIGYSNSRYRVNVFALRKTDKSGVAQTSAFPPWSVTEVHENLMARFWSNFRFPPADKPTIK